LTGGADLRREHVRAHDPNSRFDSIVRCGLPVSVSYGPWIDRT
jgi:hypothetical protein